MHPAVVKAQKIARISKENGWHGSIDSNIIENGCRVTHLNGKREDERYTVVWQNNHMIRAEYSIFGKEIELPCAKHVLSHIKGWPDVVNLFKWFPDMSRIELAEKYRRLPFDWQTDSDQDILNCLAGKHIWWYSHMSNKISSEQVIIPRKKTQVCNLKWVGHRRLFTFTATQFGIRSVLLDTILKVQ